MMTEAVRLGGRNSSEVLRQKRPLLDQRCRTGAGSSRSSWCPAPNMGGPIVSRRFACPRTHTFLRLVDEMLADLERLDRPLSWHSS